jgi:hypothetical protein
VNGANIATPNAAGGMPIERGQIPIVGDTTNNIFVPGSMRFAAINR